MRVKDDGRRDEPMGESERWNNISVVTLAVVVSTSRWPFVNVFREAVLRAKTTQSRCMPNAVALIAILDFCNKLRCPVVEGV